MYQYKGFEDTIVAISTAIGQGSIALVRLSGDDALAIADKMFKSRSGKLLKDVRNSSVVYGWVIKPRAKGEELRAKSQEQIVDEVLVTVMRAPKTYTCEDIVEISCHGGMVAVKEILELSIEHGARLAEPGEFTKRAFLYGRIDLTQAEAVLDIIQSKTDRFLQVSTNQLKGELSITLEQIREALMDVYTEIEAILNFPEDDIDIQRKGRLSQRIEYAQMRVTELLKSSDQGKILKEGIKIVLCGRPNVGKSSLLNVLLKQPRAIVSPIAGTTRDTIEETAQIQGVPFQLIDTAGVLTPRDMIEEEAVDRSRRYIQSADLILFIIDASQDWTDEDQFLMQSVKDKNLIVVYNKIDLPQRLIEQRINEYIPGKKSVKISALENQGLDWLKEMILDSVWKNQVSEGGQILISNMRHIQALKKCWELLISASQHMTQDLSLEFISEEVKSAVNCLDDITGKNIDENLLETIFSQFCIGK